MILTRHREDVLSLVTRVSNTKGEKFINPETFEPEFFYKIGQRDMNSLLEIVGNWLVEAKK